MAVELLRANVSFAVGRRVYLVGTIFTTTDPIVVGRSELFSKVEPTFPVAAPAAQAAEDAPVKRSYTRKAKSTDGDDG